MPHIVIDTRIFHSLNDGGGNYLSQLVPRLVSQNPSTRFSLIVNPLKEQFWREATPHCGCVPCDAGPVGIAHQILIPIALLQSRPDVYFFPSNTPPIFAPSRLVVTIHDLTPLTHPPYFEGYSSLKTAIFRTLVKAALWRSHRIIAVSEYTKECILSCFGTRFAKKIDVVHHGRPMSPCPPTPIAVPKDFFLYVGTDRPHKNLLGILEAYRQLLSSEPDAPDLVWAGSPRREAFLKAQLSRLGLVNKVHIMGYVEQGVLEFLYERTLAVVFPSLAEGFGLPILEAMSRGTPVITSDRSATKEVAGQSAQLVDPYCPDSIRAGLLLVWKNNELRSELKARGPENCLRFDWDVTAERTMESLRKALISSLY